MHFFREFLLKDATKKNLKSYMYSLIYTSGAQAESGSCMCDELMMKDWKGSFFSTDALKSITPKYKSLAGFQTKKKIKRWNTFEPYVYRCTLCRCFLSDRACYMPHCLVMCRVQRNPVIREQIHRLAMTWDSSFFPFYLLSFSWFSILFLLHTTIVSDECWWESSRCKHISSRQSFSGQVGERIINFLRFLFPTCTVLWVLARLNDCISSWASWYCWRYPRWQDTSAHL